MLDKLKFNDAPFTDSRGVDFFMEGTNLMVELNSRCSLLERAVLFYLVLILYSKS